MIQNRMFHMVVSTGGALLWIGIFTISVSFFLPLFWQMLLIIALVGGILFFFLMRHPEWIIYTLIVFIPLEEFLEKWIPRGLWYEAIRYSGEVLLFVLFAFVVLNKIGRGFRWNRTPVDIPLMIFLGTALLSAFLNNSPLFVAILGIRPLLRYVLVFYIITQLRVKNRFFEQCFKLCLFVATVVSIIGLLQTIIGYPLTNLLIPGDVVVGDIVTRSGLRHTIVPRTYIFSTMGRYDTLGVFLMFFLLLSFTAYVFVVRNWRRKISVFLLLGSTALLLTFSRQSWVGLGLGIAVVLLLSKRKEFQRTKLLYGVGLLLLVASIIFLLPNARYFSSALIGEATFLDRVLEPFSPRYLDVSRNYYGRLFVILEIGPRLLKLAPFFGLGPGQFGSLTASFFDVPFYETIGIPESAAPYVNDVNWIVILGQLGIFGLIAFLWMYLGLFWGALKQYRKQPRGLVKGLALGFCGSIIALLVLGFFGPNFEVRQISFFIWLWGGLIIGYSVPHDELQEYD